MHFWSIFGVFHRDPNPQIWHSRNFGLLTATSLPEAQTFSCTGTLEKKVRAVSGRCSGSVRVANTVYQLRNFEEAVPTYSRAHAAILRQSSRLNSATSVGHVGGGPPWSLLEVRTQYLGTPSPEVRCDFELYGNLDIAAYLAGYALLDVSRKVRCDVQVPANLEIPVLCRGTR